MLIGPLSLHLQRYVEHQMALLLLHQELGWEMGGIWPTERGVAKENAKYKVIVVDGFDSSKDIYLPLYQELMDEVGVYIVSFDRAGYGESDPNPKRLVRSEAFDIQELADQLKLGHRFYIIGMSLGTLAVVNLVVPVINFWWPSFPPKLMNEVYKKRLKRDQWKLWIGHYAPGLHKVRQQRVCESLHRDIIVHFGNWEFDPVEIKNPFPNNEASVHLWHGYEDTPVPYEMQQYLVKKLPWIWCHEVPDGGHLMIHESGLCEAMGTLAWRRTLYLIGLLHPKPCIKKYTCIGIYAQ
ncbi:hypothetical protein FH972_006089 [Carpinus fangiana]|uniref:AB hydrolase-1 domain-containing protein n=1 Tax=Carpinus fangiana TaxID=176857 RepID=A0A5N6QR82_9ROSI|nr:hypothetical protein FH972_006089 [Carpinus fangiana]